MPLDDQHAWTLLHSLDDPDHLEFPRGYNHSAARARFDQLATHLEHSFDCTCDVDRQVQDATRHGTIVIPNNATASPDQITITVSNFGNLIVTSLGDPGAYDADEERELLLSDDRDRIEQALNGLGLVAISQHLLEAPYDGKNDSLRAAYPGHTRTWWIRFFDYI